MNTALPNTVVFGPFSLSIPKRQLLENGQPVRLGSRALDILVVLLERPGMLVSRDELVARVWPATVVVETSLRVQVMALRRALKDGQDGARYIANAPGRGYAFVGRIDQVSRLLSDRPARDARGFDLPAWPTRVIGRDGMAARLAQRLGTQRLLTLVGPGGIGKSLLASAVADRMGGRAHVVRYVDVAALGDPGRTAAALAAALRLEPDGCGPRGSPPGFAARCAIVLVLDNCDHGLDALAPALPELLGRLQALRILATCREPMGVAGEAVVRLDGLAVPPASLPEPDAAAVLQFPAVQLLVERIAAGQGRWQLADADAATAGCLVRCLDGIPLAIELAAARAGFFGLRGLLERVQAGLDVLAHGPREAADRHRTMAALLDWSYDRLDEGSRRVLLRLSAFPGTFDLEEALAAGSADDEGREATLMRLLLLEAKSLLIAVREGGAMRYRLLRTTRRYLAARAGGPDARHAAW